MTVCLIDRLRWVWMAMYDMSISFWQRSHCGDFFPLTYFSKKSISSGSKQVFVNIRWKYNKSRKPGCRLICPNFVLETVFLRSEMWNDDSYSFFLLKSYLTGFSVTLHLALLDIKVFREISCSIGKKVKIQSSNRNCANQYFQIKTIPSSKIERVVGAEFPEPPTSSFLTSSWIGTQVLDIINKYKNRKRENVSLQVGKQNKQKNAIRDYLISSWIWMQVFQIFNK